MKDFFTYVVPDLRSQFALHGQKMPVELKIVDQFSLITMFHRVEEKTPSGIKAAIEKLLSDGILSAKAGNVDFWFRGLSESLLDENQEFFNTDENDFKTVRRGLLNP